MNLQKTLLAAAIAALPLLLGDAALAGQLMSGPVAKASQSGAGVIAALMAQRGRNGLGNEHGFAMAAQHPGVEGTTISRVNHTYKGVRVYGSESVIVTGMRGDIMSESLADRRSALGRGAAFNVTPSISADKAIGYALASLARGGNIDPPHLAIDPPRVAIDPPRLAIDPPHADIDPPRAELLVYPVMKDVRIATAANKADSDLNATDLESVVDHYELAYLVSTRKVQGNKPVFHDTLVNAHSGAIIDQWNMLHTVVGTGNSQYNGSVPLNTTLSGSTYSMIDATRGTGGTYGAMAITNANHTTSGGAVYTNSTNTWGDGQQYIAGGSTTNANGQTAAVNAMWGLMNTYDMLNNVLGWKSLDGNNTATYIAAHVNTAYDNAYYSDTCKCMYIGDGSSFLSLGSIDVIGHEMSHGVTASTSNLAYRGESGGLNESNSDIGGEMVEAYARAGGTGSLIPNTGNDWQMGTEISKTGTPLRWMYKPSKDGSSPDAWSTSLKRLDVHYSSGPNNRMFYFLSQGSNATSTSVYYSKYLTKAPLAMTGIGSDKAYRIWFKASTTKFTSSTNYADARLKVLAAAQELYGVGSKEATAVQRAYAAINVGTDVAE